jgi:hypothetical protein
MNNYAIKYRPGAGGEFLICMIEGLDQGIIVEPDENNRYVGSHVSSWHQHMTNFWMSTGLKDNIAPRFSDMEEPDQHCMTFHQWTLDYIVQLRKKNTKVLVIEDNTLHSDILAYHKIPSYNKGSVEEQLRQIDRYNLWAKEYSDNVMVSEYANRSLDIRTVNHDDFYDWSFDKLEEMLKWLAGVSLTKEWYEIFKVNTITNKGIINTYKDQFLKNAEMKNDT